MLRSPRPVLATVLFLGLSATPTFAQTFTFSKAGDTEGWQVLDEAATDDLKVERKDGRLSFRITDYATARVGIAFAPLPPTQIRALRFKASTWTIKKVTAQFVTDTGDVASVEVETKPAQFKLFPYEVAVGQALAGLNGRVIGLAFAFPGPAQEVPELDDVELLDAAGAALALKVNPAQWRLPEKALAVARIETFKPAVIRPEQPSPWRDWVYPTQGGPRVDTVDLAGPVTVFGFQATEDVDDELLVSLFESEVVLQPGAPHALVRGRKLTAATSQASGRLYGPASLALELLLRPEAEDSAREAARAAIAAARVGDTQLRPPGDRAPLALGAAVVEQGGELLFPLGPLVAASGGRVLPDARGFFVVTWKPELRIDPAFALQARALALVPRVLAADYVLTRDRHRLLAPADRVVAGRSIVQHAQATMDLGRLSQSYARQHGTPKVPLPPALVAGQGSAPENHTVVRVLNNHHVRVAQFLAYPPAVRGGVRVAAAASPEGVRIVCAPLSDATVRSVRVFDLYGGLVHEWPVPELAPPFALTTGRFLAERPGEEIIAIASASGPARVRFFTLAGTPLRELDLPAAAPLASSGAVASRRLSLAPGDPGDSLLVQEPGGEVFLVAPTGQIGRPAVPRLGPAVAIQPSPFPEAPFVATTTEPALSRMALLPPGGAPRTVDVGVQENMRWADEFQIRPGTYATRGGNFHNRVDTTPHFPTVWTENFYAFAKPPARITPEQASGSAEPPSGYSERTTAALWQTTFFGGGFIAPSYFDELAEEFDAETGLPINLVADVDNRYPRNPGKKGLAVIHPVPPAINRITYWPLRSFYTDQAVLVRALLRPEADRGFIGVSPTHEFGVKDAYAPLFIRRFRDTLLRRYGSLEAVNARFGTPFKNEREIDAPRGQGRGDWDRLPVSGRGVEPVPGSDLYREWRLFQRAMANELMMQCAKEPLLAGFPPESIHFHLIGNWETTAGPAAPGLEWRGSSTNFESMFASGTSVGFSDYGRFFDRPTSSVLAANSSGHWNITYGEYGLRIAQGAVDQMRHLFEHGTRLLPMRIDTKQDQPEFIAYQDEVARVPRPGLTGGVGEVRGAWADLYDYRYESRGGAPVSMLVPRATGQRRPFAIVQIGSGPDRPGLLKSVLGDGSWETSVYVQPFHSAIEVAPLLVRPEPLALRGGAIALLLPDRLYYGDQVEIRFQARAREGASAALGLRLRNDIKIPGAPPLFAPAAAPRHSTPGTVPSPLPQPAPPGHELLPGGFAGAAAKFGGYEASFYSASIPLDAEWREYRYVFSNQLPFEPSAFVLAAESGEGELRAIEATLQRPRIARPAHYAPQGVAHRGGVTFDLLDRDRLARPSALAPRPVAARAPAPAPGSAAAERDLLDSGFVLHTDAWVLRGGGGELAPAGWVINPAESARKIEIERSVRTSSTTELLRVELTLSAEPQASSPSLRVTAGLKRGPGGAPAEAELPADGRLHTIVFDFSSAALANHIRANPNTGLVVQISSPVPGQRVTLRQVRFLSKASPEAPLHTR